MSEAKLDTQSSDISEVENRESGGGGVFPAPDSLGKDLHTYASILADVS